MSKDSELPGRVRAAKRPVASGRSARSRRSFEYTVSVEGTAVIPYSIKVNQTADNAEEASRLARKRVFKSVLNLLDPKVTSGLPRVKTATVERAVRYPEGDSEGDGAF